MISNHVMKVYKPGINYLNYILQPSNIFVPFNPLMVSVAKTGLKIQIVSLSLKIAISWKAFEGKMFIQIKT